MILLRKISIMAIGLFAERGSTQQNALVSIVLTLSLFLQIQCQPYAEVRGHS